MNVEQVEGPRRFDIHTGTMAGDLLSALLDELRLLAKPWQALPAEEQAETIERLRKRVTENVREFCIAMNTGGRVSVAGKLVDMRFKRDLMIGVSMDTSGRHEILDALGTGVTLVLANHELYLAGINDVKPDPDQKPLDIEDEASKAMKKMRRGGNGKDKPDEPAPPAAT